MMIRILQELVLGPAASIGPIGYIRSVTGSSLILELEFIHKRSRSSHPLAQLHTISSHHLGDG